MFNINKIKTFCYSRHRFFEDMLIMLFCPSHTKRLNPQLKSNHCSNLTLINISNFQFLINTDICNVTNIAIVTLVHTAMEYEAARNVIR